MNKQFVFFAVVTIISFVAVTACIKSLKKTGVWYDLKNLLIVSIEDKVPLIIGIIMGIITSIILNVAL